eukprot:m.177250 g.177250  ORF g.177250 m.177250 type:complete len:454 (+) comp16570_c8_seq1:231-1592(+)
MAFTFTAMGADTASKRFAIFFALSALVLLVMLTSGYPAAQRSEQLSESEGDDVQKAVRRSEDSLAEQLQLLEETRLQVQQTQRQLTKLKNEMSGLKNSTEFKQFPEVVKRNEFDRKRILITGGAGFVGSHLTDALMMQGHEVTVIDNFFTGRKKNVEHWIGHPNFELINHDVVEPFMIEVDEIYHLASPASPPHYMYNPIKTIKTNTIGTINMLGLAKRVGARLLLASTSEVYGDPTVHPQPETYFGNVNPDGPRACYDEGKRIAETMCYAYQKQSGVDVRVARIFNTFGPRMHIGDGRVVSNFVIQALQGQSMTVYGDGLQTRSFQYVSDLVAGLIALMNGDFSEPVNIGNPEEYTMLDFARSIRDLVGNDVEILHKPATQDDPQRRRPDISRAKQYLNWEPKVKVVDGLRATIDYFRQELQTPSVRDSNGRGVGGPYGKEIELPYVNQEAA